VEPRDAGPARLPPDLIYGGLLEEHDAIDDIAIEISQRSTRRLPPYKRVQRTYERLSWWYTERV